MKIYFETQEVAELDPTPGGPKLRYHPDWLNLKGAFPISTTIPLSKQEFTPDIVVPWIANLLPEGDNLAAISRNTATSKTDILGLLAKIGRDTSGALSFEMRGSSRMTYRAVESEDDLERIIEELPAKPFLAGDEGVSISLAGVQTKMGVFIDDGDHDRGHGGDDGGLHDFSRSICIPIDGSPSNWILKPDSKTLWGSVWNEAFCMRLARNVGLDVPEVRLGRAGKRQFLLVQRYDRQPSSNRERWRRLHQEDYAQAAGLFPQSKYERNRSGIPGLKIPQMVDITRRVAPQDIRKFLSYVIFNTVVCNPDAHAKNYSLLITGRGVRLTPIYDVMCGLMWPSITKNMANSIDGKIDGNYLKGRHWQREARKCGVSPRLMLRDVANMCKVVEANLDRTGEEIIALDPDSAFMVSECKKYISQRILYLRNGLSELEDDDTPEEHGQEEVNTDGAGDTSPLTSSLTAARNSEGES